MTNEQYGINGSLMRRETNRPGSPPETEHYRFDADGNLQAYMYENLLYVLFGYNNANTRTYKYSFDLNHNWLNGRLENVNFNMRTAMFYPNSITIPTVRRFRERTQCEYIWRHVYQEV